MEMFSTPQNALSFDYRRTVQNDLFGKFLNVPHFIKGLHAQLNPAFKLNLFLYTYGGCPIFMPAIEVELEVSPYGQHYW